MQPEADVNMNTPMTEEEWAIWQALWRVPEFRRHYGLDHAGSLTQREIGLYLGLTRCLHPARLNESLHLLDIDL